MTDELQDQQGQEMDSTSALPAEQDLVLELNFVPDWARKPPAQNLPRSEGNREYEPKPDKRYDDKRYDDRKGKHGKPRRRREETTERKNFRPPRERDEPAPINIQFIPKRNQLVSLIRQIRGAKRSYPVMELASLLVSNPDFCLAKIEPEQTAAEIKFYQCKMCKAAALDRSSMVSHILAKHLADHFDKVETIADPPSGQFTCVARCELTGTLLGPPNHHSYAERIREIHQERFPDMSLERYKSNIRIVHDAQLIEQWKEESRKHVVYRQKGSPPDAATMKWSDAEAHMQKNIVPSLIIETSRAVVPLNVALESEDSRLLRSVKDAWQRELRYPYSLSMALRAAFHHMSLHLFKAGRSVYFVTAIRPCPLETEHVVESIREVANHLRGHPGCTRRALVDSLRPGLPPNSPQVAEVLSQLTWLIDKGHIIEFHNATLSVPLQSHADTGRRQTGIKSNA
jgi:hypothetical protein